MNILFLSNYFPKYPTLTHIGTWSLDIADSISKNNKVQVISFTPFVPKVLNKIIKNKKIHSWSNVYTNYRVNKNLEIYYERMLPSIYKSPSAIRNYSFIIARYYSNKIINRIKNNKPDLIIANHALIEGAIANVISKKLNVPYITFEHSTDNFIPISKRHYENYKKVIDESAKFITVSEYALNLINKHYNFNTNKCKTLYNYSKDAQEYDDNPTEFNLDMSKKYIIEVGNFEKRKNHIMLIKAFEKVIKKYDEWNLILLGGHIETISELKDYVAKRNLENRVIFLQNIKHESVMTLLNKIEIFVLPSLDETFGVAAMEAMSAGKPVIVTQNSAFSDSYFNDSSVLLIDPYNLDELVNNLSCLIRDSDKRKNIGRKNREIYLNGFTNASYNKNINLLMNEIVNSK